MNLSVSHVGGRKKAGMNVIFDDPKNRRIA
jgi:hypothetical protein